MIHAYGSLPHYAAHLAPILAALPGEVRGQMWAPRPGCRWGPQIGPTLDKAGADWIMVASYVDGQHFEMRHPLIYVEHGAGQTYLDNPDHGSYSGGDHRGIDFRLYLAPNETVADRWRLRGALAVAVGCPRLDVHAGRSRPGERQGATPTVAFAWHWLADGVAPEAFGAWSHYEPVMPAVIARLRAEGVTVVGHAHPRIAGKLERWYREHGVPYLDDIDEILAHADVLVADNTSALYEAAAVGLSTVVLNAPWYRRHVNHGLRFWDRVPGPMVDEPADLYDAVRLAVDVPGHGRASREAATGHVYAVPIGHASTAAATAIMEVYEMTFGKYGSGPVKYSNEVVDPADHLATRMRLLGATDEIVTDTIRAFRQGNRDIAHMSDGELAAKIGAIMAGSPAGWVAADRASIAAARTDETLWADATDAVAGTKTGVMAWVGTDAARAFVAHEAEMARVQGLPEGPRKTLIKWLAAIHGQGDIEEPVA